MIFAGIDNGGDGAFVAMDDRWNVLLQSIAPTINVAEKGKKRLPDVRGMVEILRSLLELADSDPSRIFVVLEKAQAFPKEGAVTSFNYGRGFGAWEAALCAFGIPHAVCDPKEWQKVVLKGVEGEDTKARALLKVQRGIPTLQTVLPRCRTPHKGLPDAACMAVYAQLLVNRRGGEEDEQAELPRESAGKRRRAARSGRG